MLGLWIRLACWNQLMGAMHSVAPSARTRPTGTPDIGVPDPATYGHRPQTCTDVPRHAGGASTGEARPPPRPGKPRMPGRRGVHSPDDPLIVSSRGGAS